MKNIKRVEFNKRFTNGEQNIFINPEGEIKDCIDGTVDVDSLEEEGLYPGKVIIFRQGSESPKIAEFPDYTKIFEVLERSLLQDMGRIVDHFIKSKTVEV